MSSSLPATDCESTHSPPCEPPKGSPGPARRRTVKGGRGGFEGENYQWSDEENRKYCNFLLKLRQRVGADAQGARVHKINIQMSRAVRTRTAVQCRSHNQKMLKRLGSLEAVIAYFEDYFSGKAGVALSVIRPFPGD